MATTFESLIAVAKAQKEQKDKGLEAVKLDKERREREKQRKQQEDERKEREMAAKMRQRHFEAQKREEEQKRKREAQEKAAEAARLRQQQEERDALIHGPKRAKSTGPGWPSKRQRTSDDDELGEAPGGNFLTREEKRERQKAAMFRSSSNIKRGSQVGKGYGKAGRALPGGAVNMLATSSSSSSKSGSGSVKERLMHAPNQLIKLNTVKRDMRTIDEIVSDLHQKKTLSGDQAKSFDDWFGDNKKKSSTPVKASPQPTSSSNATKKSTPVPPSRPPSAPRTAPKTSKPAPTVPKKRPRSLSPAPPPRKSSGGGGGGGSSAIRSMVWEAMNFTNKGRPSAQEVYSDDEDMEADAFSVVEEEEMSARIARREEAAALAEERRHEEEKRRRKMARQ